MIKGAFNCLSCGKSENDINNMCDCTFTLKFKLSRWSRIKLWFWGLDISCLLALAGAIAIHGVFTHHLHYNIYESAIFGLGLGFVLGWLAYGILQIKND